MSSSKHEPISSLGTWFSQPLPIQKSQLVAFVIYLPFSTQYGKNNWLSPLGLHRGGFVIYCIGPFPTVNKQVDRLHQVDGSAD